MSDLINDNTPLQSHQPKITLKDQILHQNAPPHIHIDPAAGIKRTNPLIVAKTFGIPLIQTEIYKGRIPISTPDISSITRKSKLGTNIFSDLQFVEVGGLKHIPVDCALFDVHQAKMIERTPIQGRNGRIKEYIGEDDFEINIKGVICGDNGKYPFEDVSNLIEFLRMGQSLGIVSQYLNNIFDITEVVVYDYKFEQPEGSQSYQKFTIDCWSDKPVEILIKEAK